MDDISEVKELVARALDRKQVLSRMRVRPLAWHRFVTQDPHHPLRPAPAQRGRDMAGQRHCACRGHRCSSVSMEIVNE
eukprot:365072-Chlamydomonas_euryale.AAC.4